MLLSSPSFSVPTGLGFSCQSRVETIPAAASQAVKMAAHACSADPEKQEAGMVKHM